jgi:tetratricopeptide (TPR) repeat protein
MSDALRTSHVNAPPLSDAEREARIEALLLSGLDHYFSGQYEQAIDVWTRVAFLERRHGRARAYIERARSALAEHQRESEELLHHGIAAYEAGDVDTARDLLTRAVADGNAADAALVFLQRLRRLETSTDAVRSEQRPTSQATVTAPPRSTSWPLTLAVSAIIVASILLLTRPVTSWLADLPVNGLVDTSHQDALPFVRASDLAIAHARSLAAGGHLREALRTLHRVGAADPLRPEADRLEVNLQRELLAGVGAPADVSAEAPR